jgi:cytochrome c peroxidase
MHLLRVVFLILFSVVLLSLGFQDEPKTEVELGQKLFFDPILSSDKTVSCASCHNPDFAFADSARFSRGVGGKLTKRNTPTVLNMSARDSYFWDGRAATLEEQALMPIQNPDEMNLSIPEAVKRLNNNKNYQAWFQKIYNQAPNAENLAKALAAFERTLETSDTDFEKYMAGDKQAISADAAEGRRLFIGKARCFDCHFGPDFTADEFKNIGLFAGKANDDPGRFSITKDSADLGKFKVPGLRNIALTAPYMHDGRFKTLRQVIDYYEDPSLFVHGSINTDTTFSKPLLLTEKEKQQLEAFMITLTDKRFRKN